MVVVVVGISDHKPSGLVVYRSMKSFDFATRILFLEELHRSCTFYIQHTNTRGTDIS